MRVKYIRCTGKRHRHLSAHQHAYTNVQTHPCAKRPPPMQACTLHPREHAFPCTYAHGVHAHAQSMRLLPPACGTHSPGSGHPPGHTSIARYISKRVCTQTRWHRRARTRVFTPRARARARTQPPVRTASRKALASLPPPPQRPGVGGGGEQRAGRGSQGPTPTRAVTAASFPFNPSQPRPLLWQAHQSNEGYVGVRRGGESGRPGTHLALHRCGGDPSGSDFLAAVVTGSPALMWGCATGAEAAAAAAQAPAVRGDVLQRVRRGLTCRYSRDAILGRSGAWRSSPLTHAEPGGAGLPRGLTHEWGGINVLIQ